MTPNLDLRSTRLHSLRQAGSSTKWPGVSHFAVYVLGLVALCSLAQFGLGTYIVHLLIFVPDTFECWHQPSDSWVLLERPLVVKAMQGQGGFAISSSHRNFFTVFVGAVFPAVTSMLALALVFFHFRCLSNNKAIIEAAFLLCVCLCLPLMDLGINIDRDSVPDDWSVCRTKRAFELWAEKLHREVLFAARSWIVVAMVFSIILYGILCLHAVRLNKHDGIVSEARREDLELQASSAVHSAPALELPSDNVDPSLPSYRDATRLSPGRLDGGQASLDGEADLGSRMRTGTETSREEENPFRDPANSFKDPANPFKDPANPFVDGHLPRRPEQAQGS